MEMTPEPPGGDPDQLERLAAGSGSGEDASSQAPGSSAGGAADRALDPHQPDREPGTEGAEATGANVTQAQQSQDSASDKHRTLTFVATIAGLLVVAVLVVLGTVLGRPASTANIRVIVPAPTSAGGLTRDIADESSPQFQAGMRQFREHYATVLRQHISSYATAIYFNAPAGPAVTARVAVVYLGANIAMPINPADAVNAIISRMTSNTAVTSTLTVPGLPGDTSAQCVSGTTGGRPAAACVWATDRTISIIVALTPATTSELASVLKKMQPDLDRG